MGRVTGLVSGCVPLSLPKKPAAKKTLRAAPRRLSGATHFVPHLLIDASGGPCSSSYLHRAGREAVRFLPLGLFFLSAPPSSEPYSRLNRTTCGASQIVRFFTSRQSTPRYARESGIFSCFGGAGSGVPFFERWGKISIGPQALTRCQAFPDTKEDTRIFPTNEPVDFFPSAPCGVKKFTPPDGRGTLKKFLEKKTPEPLVFVGKSRASISVSERH